MKNVKKRIIRALDELMIFFIDCGCLNVSINYSRNPDSITVRILGERSAISDEQLNTLKQCIAFRAPEGVEEEFWQLAGESDMHDGSELALIRSMMDDAVVTEKDGMVEVCITKKLPTS